MKIESFINRANPSTYRIRVVHGFNRGNAIQQAIYRELGHGLNPKVLRIVGGDNPGITELYCGNFNCSVPTTGE